MPNPFLLHITSPAQWAQARREGVYRGDTLQTEGFIHCSTPSQVVAVANSWFAGQKGLLLLWIDPQRLQTEIRWEDPGEGQEFPHIYGPLNIDAVFSTRAYEPGEDGLFPEPIFPL